MNPLSVIKAVVVSVVVLLVSGVCYIVPESQQVIVTQFGRPVGEPVTRAGLRFKVPFIQTVNRLEKRVLEWDGPSAEMATKDKLYIVVDSFGRWRISDPMSFFLRLRDERSAQSRLDDILGSEMRNTVARHELVELIRTTKNREAQMDGVAAREMGGATGWLPPIRLGRVALEEEITRQSKKKLAEFGIELLDVRLMRINYNQAVSSKIYDRMISERRQIAERFRSEGAGEAAKIIGAKERDLRRIESEAFREVQTIQGRADAEATAVYAEAYNQSPHAREFYSFTQTLETYRSAFDRETTLLLSTEGGLFHLFKGPGAPPSFVPRPVSHAPSAPAAPAAAAPLKKGAPTPKPKSEPARVEPARVEPVKEEPVKVEPRPEPKPEAQNVAPPKEEFRREASVLVEPDLPQRRVETPVKSVPTPTPKKSSAELSEPGLVPSAFPVAVPPAAPLKPVSTPVAASTPVRALATPKKPTPTPVAVRPRPLATPAPTPVVAVPAEPVAQPVPEATPKSKPGLLQLFQKKPVKVAEPGGTSGDGAPAP
jgi:membrane protease subunit HflC